MLIALNVDSSIDEGTLTCEYTGSKCTLSSDRLVGKWPFDWVSRPYHELCTLKFLASEATTVTPWFRLQLDTLHYLIIPFHQREMSRIPTFLMMPEYRVSNMSFLLVKVRKALQPSAEQCKARARFFKHVRFSVWGLAFGCTGRFQFAKPKSNYTNPGSFNHMSWTWFPRAYTQHPRA